MNPLHWWKNLKRRHKWLSIFTAVWFVILVAAHTPLFYTFGPDWMKEEFAESFWPSFISDFGVGLLLVWLLEDVVKRATHQDHDLQIHMEVLDEKPRFKTLRFDVINTGPESFAPQQIKWNIYVEPATIRTVFPDTPPRQNAALFEKTYRRYNDVLETPLYPGERITLMEIVLQWPGGERARPIYGYLSTVAGLFPRPIKMGDDGQVLPGSLSSAGSKFEVQLPEVMHT